MYRIKPIKSNYSSERIALDQVEKHIANFVGNIQSYYILAHLSYEVLIGYVQQGKMMFHHGEGIDVEHLLEIRIFNEDTELYITKYGENFISRVRVDNIGDDEIDSYDEVHTVFGTKVQDYKGAENRSNGWKTLIETRGTKIHIPFSITNDHKEEPKLYYRIRNYMEVDGRGIRFLDARLCCFLNKDFQRMEVKTCEYK